MDTTILEDLGLSNAEARIYLALLELGSCKSGKIIDKTKLQSSTVYHLLGSLLEKGLVSFVLKGKIKYFQASPPESFLQFLEEKRKRFLNILPKLKEKETLSKQKQTARVYEGIKGLQTAFNDILLTLKKGDEYYFFQAIHKDLQDNKLHLFFRNYHLKRAEQGIQVKGLALNKDRPYTKRIFHSIARTNIRFLHEFAPNGVIIYKNKVITLDLSNIPTAIVMESKSISDSYKRFFKQKWEKAKK